MGQLETKFKTKEPLLTTWNLQKPTDQQLTLPVEIIMMILELLDLETLRRLTLVSRFFRSLLSDDLCWRRFPNSRERFCFTRLKLDFSSIMRTASWLQRQPPRSNLSPTLSSQVFTGPSENHDSTPPNVSPSNEGRLGKEPIEKPEDFLEPDLLWAALKNSSFLLIRLPEPYAAIISAAKRAAKEFFSLPTDLKERFETIEEEMIGFGWRDEQTEILELKEGISEYFPWPNQLPPLAVSPAGDPFTLTSLPQGLVSSSSANLSGPQSIGSLPVQSSTQKLSFKTLLSPRGQKSSEPTHQPEETEASNRPIERTHNLELPTKKLCSSFPSAENGRRDIQPLTEVFRKLSRALLLIFSHVSEPNTPTTTTTCFNAQTGRSQPDLTSDGPTKRQGFDPQLERLYFALGNEEKQKENCLFRITNFWPLSKPNRLCHTSRIDGSIFTLSTKLTGITVGDRSASIFMRERDLILIPGMLFGEQSTGVPQWSSPNYFMDPNKSVIGFQYRVRPQLTEPYLGVGPETYLDFLRSKGFSTEEKYPWP